ncbi:MAG: hypothetical protein NVS9B12_03700 [Vulcanimicrobiaceae bacterium]
MFAPAVFLDHEETRGFHTLVRGEAVLAAQIEALAAAAHDVLVIAGIHHAGFALAASWTVQGPASTETKRTHILWVLPL